MIHSARIFLATAASTISGYASPRFAGNRDWSTPQIADNSARSAALSNLRYPGRLEVNPASRVPMALHWPVIENGEAPARPMCPVSDARLQIAFTVAVPSVL